MESSLLITLQSAFLETRVRDDREVCRTVRYVMCDVKRRVVIVDVAQRRPSYLVLSKIARTLKREP